MATIGAVNDPTSLPISHGAASRAGDVSGLIDLTPYRLQACDAIESLQPGVAPLLDRATATLVASAPKPSGDAPLSDASVTGKISDSLRSALMHVARDGTGALAELLKAPKKLALMTAGLGAAVGTQFIPVAGEAVDIVAGVAGVAMYAAAGKEHRARIGESLAELKKYLHGVSSAKTQGELDVASGHLTKFLEIGGEEAVQGLKTVAGAVAAPAKFAGLLADVKELGGLEGVAAAGAVTLGKLATTAKSLASDAGELASRGWSAVKEAAGSATGAIERAGRGTWQAAGRAVDTAGRTVDDGLNWLERRLGYGEPERGLPDAGVTGNVAPESKLAR